MKKSLFFFGTLLSFNLAQACLGEARITGYLQGIQPANASTCYATIDLSSVEVVQNSACPVSLSEVAEQGFYLESKGNSVCSFHPGEHISGVITKNENGSFVLDQLSR